MHREVPPPLGVSRSAAGHSTFAVAASPNVSSVQLCMFDGPGPHAAERQVELDRRLGSIWWADVDLAVGTRYGVRVTGSGFDRSKLIVDPWARAIDGTVDWLSSPAAHQPRNGVDSAPFVPRCVVTDQNFDWGDDRPLRTPWADTVIYEVHLRNATMTHPDVPASLRGTYAGFAHQAFVGHLQRLGVTAVELLPIHQHVSEPRLAALGLTNSWGYNTLGYLAPHQAYAASADSVGQVQECKAMIRDLHAAGIEVILDVVYNHTCEGPPDGPTLSLRGLHGNALYRSVDTTGCGNTLDLTNPLALRLVLDSLRMWVSEYHVDGFRFDLATSLARTAGGGFDPSAVFLAAVAQDPVLSQVKLIAEPWDVGVGGYQVGSFPAPWAEWNDRYRDLVRDHWRNDARPLGALARRITGNADLFAGSGRAPWTSINFVTAHDGFTLADLVAYDRKHNDANGEENRDGTDANRSWNHGVEGPTDSADIVASRKRSVRNFLATLLLSHGTPMLLGGDELGRTQQGNNNAYCHDSTLVWFDWANADQALIEFTAAALRLRRSHRALHPATWLTDDRAQWFAPSGAPMTVTMWDDPNSVGLLLRLRGFDTNADSGAEPDLVLVLHEGHEAATYALPAGSWRCVLDTDPQPGRRDDVAVGSLVVEPRTVLVFELVDANDGPR